MSADPLPLSKLTLRVLLDKPPDIETPIVWGQFWFGCIINSTYSGGLPKLKSLDLGACTVLWDANQVLELKQAFLADSHNVSVLLFGWESKIEWTSHFLGIELPLCGQPKWEDCQNMTLKWSNYLWKDNVWHAFCSSWPYRGSSLPRKWPVYPILLKTSKFNLSTKRKIGISDFLYVWPYT